MPESPITPIIGEITEMQTAFKQPSCNSKLPFVEYPSVGTPPVISFNVPQNTAFVTYGHMVRYFPPAYFKPFTKQIPENNYFNTIRNMTAQQATDMFEPAGDKWPVWRDLNQPPRYVNAPGPSSHGAAMPIAGLSPIDEAKPVPTSQTNPTTSTPTTPFPGMYGVAGAAASTPGVFTPLSDFRPQAPTLKANYAANGLRPYDITRLNGQAPVTKYVAEPPRPVPRIIVLEEYTTVSYLGNYGAGRVLKTFSLYPGERTTISVRTYKDKVTTKESSKNVLDSFSDSSATALDTLMQQEQGILEGTSTTSGTSGSSFTTNTDTRNSNRSFGISGGLNLGFLSIGGGYGRSSGDVSTTGSGMASTYDYNQTAARQSNVNTLSSALNKHVQQSNAARSIDVNTSTSDVSRSGEEDVTVRELKNVNLNHVLNITYRQLLQEYTVITYLSGLKFAYTNGYPESYTVTDLQGLQNMLLDILDTDTDPTVMDSVMCKLLQPYCNVLNYQDSYKQFVEKIPITNTDCLSLGCTPPLNENLFRIPPTLEEIYSDGVVEAKIKGVILRVQKQTLQTSSLIADALLGRGDALDCFNQNAQNAENIRDYVNNLQSMQRLTDSIQTTANSQLFADQQLELGDKQVELATKKVDMAAQQMDVITSITDPLAKATHYKKVFGDCCDVPQSCCGGGCGCGCAETPPTA
jgi:hypothetical protein